jgi:pimeloyl-ACP methyl ester carboxylesterase
MSGFPEVHRAEPDPAGRPLVLLHGGNVANWMWEPQVAAFTDRIVLTPDLPGFGQRVGEDWLGLDAMADGELPRRGNRAALGSDRCSHWTWQLVSRLAFQPDAAR